MQDILERLKNSSTNESSHELQCRCEDAAAEIERLRTAISYAIDRQQYHGSANNSVHISRTAYIRLKAVMTPNMEFRPMDAALSRPVEPGTPGYASAVKTEE